MSFLTRFLGIAIPFFLGFTTTGDEEVIYARRDGLALTMTILRPTKPNGKAIISVVSSGWYCDHSWFDQYKQRAMPFVDAGYTVFLTEHSSAPRYAIPDAFSDVRKAVQYVRFHAQRFGIDPHRIGITGTSSGGHLALLSALSDDAKDESSGEPIERVSSKVQAVAVFCAPADFLNYGKKSHSIRNEKQLLRDLHVEPCFRYSRFDAASDAYVPMTESESIRVDSLMSPIQLVSSDDVPVYISHGDKDDIVPIEQSRNLVARLKNANVRAELAVVPNAGHGWKNMNEDEKAFVDWFNRYLNQP